MKPTSIALLITALLLIGCGEKEPVSDNEKFLEFYMDTSTYAEASTTEPAFKVATVETGQWILDTVRLHSNDIVAFFDKINNSRARPEIICNGDGWGQVEWMKGIWINVEYSYKELDTIGVY